MKICMTTMVMMTMVTMMMMIATMMMMVMMMPMKMKRKIFMTRFDRKTVKVKHNSRTTLKHFCMSILLTS